MPIVTLHFKDMDLGEFRIDKGGTLTIGRRETNTIVIDNLAVSGQHAKIDALDDGYLLTDLNSKNGTFVNDRMVTTHWLKPGDVITIGKHKLVFQFLEGEVVPVREQQVEKTMVLDTNEYRAMVGKSASTVTAEAPAKREQAAVLSFLKGGDGEVPLTKKLVKIGKDETNDIVVGGFLVGKTAATISKRPTGYFLSYVEGLTKPKVNGKTVKETVQLKEFDRIEIGSATLEFILKE
ncbi:MAG: FHA domain-containing protein [Desulfobacterota bacterium]|nr:FHA domain-containing protein [Thermodesulfobacteriota bacterium]